MLTKFELRLQLDSASIATVVTAVQGSMSRVSDTMATTCERLRKSMHDMAWYQRQALQQSGELHTLLVNRLTEEIEKAAAASRMAPTQPAHPPPAELLGHRQTRPSHPAPGPPGPLPQHMQAPTVCKPGGKANTRQPPPAKTQKPLVPRQQAACVPPAAKPMPAAMRAAQTQDFHLHHFLVVIQQTCSLH